MVVVVVDSVYASMLWNGVGQSIIGSAPVFGSKSHQGQQELETQ